ncbi:MAG TPA: hypothetical protein VH208_00915, partial [Myxococcaceae bacterium]|nr:hypothetical protein [Myxococcaceae bacterium]
MAPSNEADHSCAATRDRGLKVPRPRFSVALAAAALLALAACGASSSSEQQQTSHINTRDLFTEGYDKIAYYYIEPTNPEKLGIAGLGKLT